MILEVAILYIKPNLNSEFEKAFKDAFKDASKIIKKMKGYISHELQKCLEEDNKYILLVKWGKLEDHTIGFRESAEYQEWKSLLHDFYNPFPVVEHYTSIDLV
ncbi:antibiotic biosynthesis monooxygenase family protein [Paenibacillus agilis]|uniref:Antibiotic biosynthesis monooxygenase n=1 Tax=Paenibacillus agilis TaxID=3020863 RepID=A0A559J1P5_9BACL|nr:antibiotic biosynthesis monooxygenase [Paenibacillus agilis]TVX93814.1 antibiotic biosynthesis monooxygenase [Paenibacillus agilis]